MSGPRRAAARARAAISATPSYLFGAVCPARGIGAALVLPHVNIEAMTLHRAEISSQIAPTLGRGAGTARSG